MKMKNDQVLYWREAKAMLKAKVADQKNFCRMVKGIFTWKK